MDETLSARYVFDQSNGDVTTAYYLDLNRRGPIGMAAVCLFRAQKTSTRAKVYSRRFKGRAYDVKSWSMDKLCEILEKHGAVLGIQYGWKEDPNTLFGERASWVLYCDLPQGQVSFHSPIRGHGPDYPGEFCGEHKSEQRILAFCDEVAALPLQMIPSSIVEQSQSGVSAQGGRHNA